MWSQSKTDDYYNGTLLVGMCNCGCQGCNDLIAKIKSNSKTTKWTIMMDRDHKKRKEFSFTFDEYKKSIEKLLESYYSYSWETDEDKIRRQCTEYIRTFSTKEGYSIEGAKIATLDEKEENDSKKLSNIIEVYYYSGWEPVGEGYGTPYHSWKVKFDGKNNNSAIRALNRLIKKENLIKNAVEVNPRPSPFRLLYTKDKDIINKLNV